MSFQLGSAFGRIELDSSGVRSGVADARNALGGFQSSVSAVNVAVGVMAADLARNMVSMGASLVRTGVDFNAMKQSASVAFTTIIGDAGKANAVMADLQKFAAETPFEFPELASASKSLLAFGVGAEDVVDTLRRIGDISSGIGAPVGEIAELYGKARVQGRLFAQDINQLTGRGIPIIQELAKQFGVTDDKVRELVEDGEVGFDNLEKAFVALTGKGGKFNNMMAAQSKTFNGLLSTAKDTVTQLSGKVMEPFFKLMQEGLEWFISFTSQEDFTKWIEDVANGIERDVIPNIKSVIELVRMIATGDFRGGIFGLNEDDPWIMALLDGRRALMGVLEWVQRVFEYASKGNWEAVWAVIGNGLKNAWTQTIQPTLAAWGAEFWNWLTGPGGALEQAKTKLGEITTGIGEWLKTNGPAAWEQLKTWGSEFWAWLTDDSEGSAMTIGKARIFLLLNTIVNEIETLWKKVVVPTLENLGGTIMDFLKAPETQNAAYYAGADLGNSIGNGIVAALKKKGEGGNNEIFAPIGKALSDTYWAIRAADEVAIAFGQGLINAFKPVWEKEIAPQLREMFINFLKSLLIQPLVQYGESLRGNEMPKFVMPGTLASPYGQNGGGGFGVGGGVGSVVVMIDGQEIKNAMAEWTFGQVQSLFADATAAAGAP